MTLLIFGHFYAVIIVSHQFLLESMSAVHTELKMTEWKTMVHISASSQSSIAVQQKIVLADRS